MNALLIQPESSAAALHEARQYDRPGHIAHVTVAILYFWSLGFATAPASALFGVLAGISIIRLPHTWQSYRLMLRERIGWIIALWCAFHALSLLWSPNIEMGWDEVKAMRGVVTPLLLWPVIDYVAWMIGALLIGVAGQNVVQLAQGMEWIERPASDGPRLRGLLHPVLTATLCLMAMCWHLSAILASRGVVRWLCAVGLIAAGAGMMFTGSRGPWLAAAVTIPLMLLGLAARQSSLRKPMLIGCGVLAIAGALCWPLVDELVMHRIEKTRADVEVIFEGDFSRDVGYRLASWQAAWDMFTEHPVAGIGAGGYGSSVGESQHADVLIEGTHAHSIYMQTLASTGVIGAVLLAAIVIGCLVRAWRDRLDHPFAAGTCFALIAWLLAGFFDASHLNGQMFGVFTAIVALTLPMRPQARPLAFRSLLADSGRSADTHGNAPHQYHA